MKNHWLQLAQEKKFIFWGHKTLRKPTAFKAEAFMDRMKDQFRKKKITQGKNFGRDGASAVEERWSPMPADEDYWVPIRPNTNTRVKMLLYIKKQINEVINTKPRLFNNDEYPANITEQVFDEIVEIYLKIIHRKGGCYLDNLYND